MGDRGPFATPHRRNRRPATKPTEPMIRLYERYLWCFPVYLACIRRDSACVARQHGLRCATCEEATVVTGKLREMIRPYNWDTSGVGADQEAPGGKADVLFCTAFVCF